MANEGKQMTIVFYLDDNILPSNGLPDLDNLLCARKVNGVTNTVFQVKVNQVGQMSKRNEFSWVESYAIGATTLELTTGASVCIPSVVKIPLPASLFVHGW
jgi:hypothetical protein